MSDQETQAIENTESEDTSQTTEGSAEQEGGSSDGAEPSLLDPNANPDAAETKETDREPGTRPEGLADHLWDEENSKFNDEALYTELQKQEKIAGDLRKKVGQKGDVPEKAEDYKLPVDESWGLSDEQIKEDPVVQKYIEAAHAAGMDQGTFGTMFKEIMGTLQEQSQNAEPVQLTEEQQEEHRKAEYAKIGPNAPAVIKAVTEFGRQLEAQGVFGERDTATMKAHAYDGDFVILMNKMREMIGGQSVVPMAVDETGTTGLPSMQEIHDMMGKASNDEDLRKAEGLIAKRAAAGLSTDVPVQ